MSEIVSIPSYFYKSSDFISSSKVSKDIQRISNTAIPGLEQGVDETLRTAKSVLENTNAFLATIKENPISISGVCESTANQILGEVNSGVGTIIGSSSSTSYITANGILGETNSALNSILSSGSSNQFYNPADQIASEVAFAVKYIFSKENKEEVSSTNLTNQIFNDVNETLDAISNAEQNEEPVYANSGISANLFSYVNSSISSIFKSGNGENSSVYANSGQSSNLLSYVNTNVSNIFAEGNGENSSVYANSGESANLFAYVDTNLNNIMSSGNGENGSVYANSGESASLLSYVHNCVSNIMSAGNGEGAPVYSNSTNSYHLFQFVNAWTSQLFANPV